VLATLIRFAFLILFLYTIVKSLFWGDPLVVMEDNAPAHNSLVTQAQATRNTYLLRSLPCRTSSPDLNPIEESWSRMKDQIASLPNCPTTIETMQDSVWAAWSNIDQSIIQNIVDTMPTRIQAVILARGGHTCY